MAAIHIPLFFYELGSIIYVIASIVGILLSYYSFKLYNFSHKKEHMFLTYGLILMAMGFIVLVVSTLYGFSIFWSCYPICRFDLLDPAYLSTVRVGNYLYYLITLAGYGFIAMSYLKNFGRSKFFILSIPLNLTGLVQKQDILGFIYPFINSYFQLFHLLSLVILTFIVSNSLTNYFATKNRYRLLVMLGFGFIAAYHFLMVLTEVNAIVFALAHISLLAGLASLLYMLVKVGSG